VNSPVSINEHAIFIESGNKRVFAGAVEWPGWCRSGRDDASAIQTLLDYGARYSRVVASARLGFDAPEEASCLRVVERVAGNSTTDFGAPDAPLSSDKDLIDASELRRLQAILESCWAAFDEAVKAAEGRQLRKGPRGGGRDSRGITDHVLMADAAYLKRIGWSVGDLEQGDVADRLSRMRQKILNGLAASVRGELPTKGPRGGKRWAPRFFVRRVAWHAIDHAWEIEDRIE
jgi:hypothetical protein